MLFRRSVFRVDQEVDDLVRLSGFESKLPKVHRPVFKSPDDELPVLSIIDASGNPIFLVQVFIVNILVAVGIFQLSSATTGEEFLSVLRSALSPSAWWAPHVSVQVKAVCRDREQQKVVETVERFFASPMFTGDRWEGPRVTFETQILPLPPATLAALKENPCYVHAKWRLEAAS